MLYKQYIFFSELRETDFKEVSLNSIPNDIFYKLLKKQ